MGLLDDFLSAVDNRKRVLKRNLLDFVGDPNGTANVWADRMNEDRYGGAEEMQAVINQIKGKPYDKQALARAEQKQKEDAINQAFNAITVWHGSPHKFNKFDMSKIGTGEGAQAYGHGLYTAESKSVGTEYKNALSDWSPRNEAIKAGSPEDQAQAWIAEALDSQSSNPYFHAAQNAKKSLPPEQYAQVEKVLGRWEGENAQFDKGYLYKVDIPDEAVARFLDWDKPLSQQAPEVQAAMQQIKGKFPLSKEGWDIKPFIDADPLFSTVHNAAVRELDIPADFFQREFKQQGIPGIRYLDGGSRGQQTGTSNFVLFDDQMPRILEVNGVPTGQKAWMHNEWRGLLGE